MPGLNLEFSDSQGPFPTQQNPHVAISLIIACVGIPALLSSTQTPTRSHSLVPGVHTSNQICPLEDAPKEKACTGLENRLVPPRHGITAPQVPGVIQSKHIGSDWVHPFGPMDSLPCGRPQPEGTSVKAKVRASQGRCPMPQCFPTDPTPPNGNNLTFALHFTVYKIPSHIILLINPLNLVKLQYDAI